MNAWNLANGIALVVVALFLGIRVHAVRSGTAIGDGPATRYLYPAVVGGTTVALWNAPIFEPAWLQLALLTLAPFAIGFVIHLMAVRRQRRREAE
jgi:hypothetical protein